MLFHHKRHLIRKLGWKEKQRDKLKQYAAAQTKELYNQINSKDDNKRAVAIKL